MFHDVPQSYDLKGNLRHNGPTWSYGRETTTVVRCHAMPSEATVPFKGPFWDT